MLHHLWKVLFLQSISIYIIFVTTSPSSFLPFLILLSIMQQYVTAEWISSANCSRRVVIWLWNPVLSVSSIYFISITQTYFKKSSSYQFTLQSHSCLEELISSQRLKRRFIRLYSMLFIHDDIITVRLKRIDFILYRGHSLQLFMDPYVTKEMNLLDLLHTLSIFPYNRPCCLVDDTWSEIDTRDGKTIKVCFFICFQ